MMSECEGDVKRAAAELGISKRYLHYLLEIRKYESSQFFTIGIYRRATMKRRG
jgi:hypothetical protein